ncbi:hypothetical protein R1sor_010826 [Riccia sorocarpa]|uniref:Uncharacterized protein n=1 Tax=Riccia sorocarpa TaxID=122646 RepID=A0ABD3HZ44_9MARC
MDFSVTADTSRPRNMKQEARLRQTTINNKPPPKPTAKVLKPRKPRTVPPKDLDVSITVGIAGEDVIGETYDRLALFIQEKAKMGNLKRDPFDEIPSPLQHDAEDDDEHEDDEVKRDTEPEDYQQPAAEDNDRKPTPPRPSTPRARTKEDDDECGEYIDMDTYPLDDKSREEVMQELLGSGYNCLFRRTKVKNPPKPNDRDIPGINGGPPLYLSLH